MERRHKAKGKVANFIMLLTCSFQSASLEAETSSKTMFHVPKLGERGPIRAKLRPCKGMSVRVPSTCLSSRQAFKPASAA